MADTVTSTIHSGGITLVYEGAGADYNSATADFPDGVKLKSIKFYGTAGDILIVRNGSTTGPILAKMKDGLGYGSADVSFGEGVWCKPVVTRADCTYTTPASVSVMFVLA